MKALSLLVLMTTLATATMAADKVTLNGDDTPPKLLLRQMGQKVELLLKSGDHLSGTVKGVNEKCVHIAALTDRNLYDAIVVMDDINAIVLRNDGK
jgi:hypothetical protein